MLNNQINVGLGITMFALFIYLWLHAIINNYSLSIASLRVLILFLVTVINLWLVSRQMHVLSKVFTLFLPLLVFILVPTFTGFVEEESFVYYPFIIIAFSVVPQLLLVEGKDKVLFRFSILYHLILLIIFDRVMVFFSPERFIIIERIDTFYAYYKISHLLLFVFINLSVFYLRKVNLDYETELTKANSFLSNQSKLLEDRNRELEASWQKLESHNVSLEVYKETLEDQNQELNMALTELKETQSKLLQTEKLASLGILVAGVAHEVNNPLNYLAGGAEILEIELTELRQRLNQISTIQSLEYNEKDILRSITMIKEGVSRLKSITQELNSYSSGLNLEKKEENLNNIIDSAINLLSIKLKDDIIIYKKYEFKRLIKVYPEKLNQVFINIIDNAIFALKQNQRGLRQIEIHTFELAEEAIVTITNNGPMIDENNMNRIFDPFFTTKDVNEGSGLGMAITFNIVRDHQGEIEIINQPGRVGFQIVLPLA